MYIKLPPKSMEMIGLSCRSYGDLSEAAQFHNCILARISNLTSTEAKLLCINLSLFKKSRIKMHILSFPTK